MSFENAASVSERLFRVVRRVAAMGLMTSAIVVGSPPFVGSHVARAADADGPPVVTFTGLRVYKDGSSTLFVELTRTTPVEVARKGKDITFLLAGAKVRWRNNKNPLLADYFGTNVVRAVLEDGKDGVRLRVKLRENVHLDHDMGSSAVGARLRVDVPPPSSR